VKSIGVGNVDIDDTPCPIGVVRVIRDEVQLHRSPLDETVLGWFVQLRRKTQSSIAGKSSIEIVRADDGSDAFEDHLSHDKKR
jgi:hypothetical protein